MNNQHQYWNGRYSNEGEIWGNEACFAAQKANKFFKEYGVSTILVPGCGTGRNSLFLAKHGFNVSGFDISDIAVTIAVNNAKIENINIPYWHDDILTVSFDCMYNGILSINMLHLFNRADRIKVVEQFARALSDKGVLALTSMSVNDADYGKGKETEYNTFESKPGRPVYYFDEQSMIELLSGYFNICDLEEIKEYENHGGKEHYHNVIYVQAIKKDCCSFRSSGV